MPFLMVRNDITKMTADAIVNTANQNLHQGSGTSKAIYMAAGEKELNAACGKIGHCDLGKAVITEAFGLNAKYIIHAVGPVWDHGVSGEEALLYNTYMESLKLAAEYKCESIAFPLISSGNYGFPKDKAMKVALSAISDFLMEQEMLVYMVLYDRDSLAISQKLFHSIEEYIDDNYVEENNENLDEDERYSCGRGQSPEERRRRLGNNTSVEFNAAQSNMDICFEVENKYEDTEEIVRNISMMSISPPVPAPMQVPKRSLENMVENLDETFTEMLLRLIDERSLKDSYVYKKANVDRRHFSKIRNDKEYAPNKKTVIAFAIALELTLDEAVDLLRKAGFAFSSSSKFDVIICYFIENREFNIFEINEVLFIYGQPLLGE